MFSGFMLNTWYATTMVAVVAGVVGFFVVLRGAAFPAHALPQGGFAGAAGAALIGVNTIAGLGVFSFVGALGIALFGRRGRHDVATALVFVLMLGLGALFLSMSTEYAPEIYALLFGEILGVSNGDLLPLGVLAIVCLAAVACLYRPLLLSSVVPEIGEAKGVRVRFLELAFLLLVALATTMTVPVVGAFLMFSLMTAPASAARSITDRPGVACALSVAFAIVVIWGALVASYLSNWPIGFYVGAFGAAAYACGRLFEVARRRRGVPVASLAVPVA